jgi:hypothetical protein
VAVLGERSDRPVAGTGGAAHPDHAEGRARQSSTDTREAAMRTRARRGLTCTIVVTVLAAAQLLIAAPAAMAARAGGCRPVTGLPAGFKAGNSTLDGVAVASPCDIWAVGTIAVRWNGATWLKAAIASAAGPKGSTQLDAVAIVSDADAWAVGSYGTDSHALIEHWNGTSWTIAARPALGGRDSLLTGITATSPADAWAVGTYYTGTAVRSVIEHWNGKSWSVQARPQPGGTADVMLTAITATSPSDAWAAGTADVTTSRRRTVPELLTFHWNGRRWLPVAGTRFPAQAALQVNAVTVVSKSGAWAVGDYCVEAGCQTVTDHWDGRRWTRVPSPSPGPRPKNVDLAGVTATSARNAWAVGSWNDNTTPKTLIEHWNGTTWTQVPSRNPGGQHDTFLTSAGGRTRRDLVAVGSYLTSTGQAPLIVPLR